MRELVYLGPGKAGWRDGPAVALGSDDAAVVRPLAVSTCDMDAAAMAGLVRLRGPAPLGHEAVAEIVELGDRVNGLSTGQRVIVPWQISCGHCSRCQRSHDAYCTSVPAGSCYGWGPHIQTWRGMARDRVLVPHAQHMLHPVPDGLPNAAATGLGDNLVDAWRAVGPPLQETRGDAVLVVGGVTDWGGSIGLYACAYAQALGVQRTVFVSQSPELRRQAQDLGVEAIAVDGEQYPDLGPSFDVTVDTSGLASGLAFALRSTGPSGTCTCTAGAVHRAAPVPVPVYEMYLRSVTLRTGWVSTRPLIPAPLALVTAGRVDPLAGARIVAWDEAPAALAEPFTKLVFVDSHGNTDPHARGPLAA